MSQINCIEDFILSENRNLIINYVNEELGIFYTDLIKHFANQKDVKLISNLDLQNNFFEESLFNFIKINLLTTNNTKKIEQLIMLDYKKIIFTDYKNFKKFNSKIESVNGYKYEKDICDFIEKSCSINNKDLLSYCINNPAVLFAEILKYNLNIDKYTSNHQNTQDTSHILNIRKNIFNIKKSSFDIKDLYLNIKKEVRYKKFNFLIL